MTIQSNISIGFFLSFENSKLQLKLKYKKLVSSESFNRNEIKKKWWRIEDRHTIVNIVEKTQDNVSLAIHNTIYTVHTYYAKCTTTEVNKYNVVDDFSKFILRSH